VAASRTDNGPVDQLRDKSFAAYVKATVGGKGFGLRAIAAALLSAGLIVSQGIVGLIVVLAALIGAPIFAYPLWRRWGRTSRFSD
jgi:hypothetical protein